MTMTDDLDREERIDQARAAGRGERLRAMANDVVSALVGRGQLHGDLPTARITAFHVLADHLYANAAIDVPRELGKP